MKVKVNSCICIWFVNVFMGIKMPNFVPLTAGCPIFTVNRASQCDAYFHGGMPIFTVNIGIGIVIFA